MTAKDDEFKAFHVAKINPKPEKRKEALRKVKRRGLLTRLVNESEFPDSRLNAMKKLDTLDPRKASPEERAFYLKLALKESVTEIRHIAARHVDPTNRDKLTGSAYADIRLMLAQMTSSRDVLMRLLVDKDPAVVAMAEKGLRKRGLQESARPYSVN